MRRTRKGCGEEFVCTNVFVHLCTLVGVQIYMHANRLYIDDMKLLYHIMFSHLIIIHRPMSTSIDDEITRLANL